MLIQSGNRWIAGACVVASLLAGPVMGADSVPDNAATAELEEVVVTAERREVDLQKTALSVTAISAEQVEKTGVTSYENLLEAIPGIQVQATLGPMTQPYIAYAAWAPTATTSQARRPFTWTVWCSAPGVRAAERAERARQAVVQGQRQPLGATGR